jgi:GntR family transcriptional regulator, transcriptional repressor for pyruvate dehydrogenase complex
MPSRTTSVSRSTRPVASKTRSAAATPKRPAAIQPIDSTDVDPVSTYGVIKVPKAGEVVAARIRRQIASGKLPIGHQLPQEEELTATFGIARTTLREALRVLESQGLIGIKRGRGGGAIVTEPKLDSLSEMIGVVMQLRRTTLGDLDDARMMIEPPLAGRLARKHTQEDLDVLNAIVARADAAAESSDGAAFGHAAAALHEAIITRAGNNTMAIFGSLLHDILEYHFGSAAANTEQDLFRRAVRSYKKLLKLIDQGDEAGATAHWLRQLTFMYQHRSGLQMLDVYND